MVYIENKGITPFGHDPRKEMLKTKSLSSLRSLTVSAFLFPYENQFSTDPKRQSPVADATRLFVLRREGDSNPRYPLQSTTV